MPRALHSLITRLALLTLLLTSNVAMAEQQLYYRLPGAVGSVSDDAVTLKYGAYHETYVPGLGWLSSLPADPPLVVGDDVLVNSSVLDALGVNLPRLEGFRTSGGAELRIVLDLPALTAAQLATARTSGSLAAGQALTIDLPPLLLPATSLDDTADVIVDLSSWDGGTRLRVSGPELSYNVFPLDNPTRLVLDLTPKRDLTTVTEVERQVSAGVTYRRFKATTLSGASVVHLVSVAPNAGEFRVVGESQVGQTVQQLSSGALIGLNAGYFDTSTFAAIGYLLIDHGLLSLPSRNRASVAFSFGGAPLIDRVDADVKLHTSQGEVRVGSTANDGVQVVRKAGSFAGNGTKGVLLINGTQVVENKIGPRRVPEGGYALVYPPDNRELALLDSGDTVFLDANMRPAAFQGARYAVEAGPLLIKDGQPAYQPTLESFATGERILDGLTQQAAIGVTADGTTLLLVAETMRAADLIPLFISLGADRAMRLDSGSSTTLVVEGKVVNRAVQRRVVSAIVLVPFDAGH